MQLSIQEKQQFASGNKEAQKRVLNKRLESYTTILKSASDINTLKVAQGAVQILEALIDSLD